MSKLEAIDLQNFRGVKERIRVPLRPLTLVFGPNSVGKSTILRALLYAQELLERGNADAEGTEHGGELIDLGGFRNLVFGHDTFRQISLGFELRACSDGLPVYSHLSFYGTETPHDRLSRRVDSMEVLLSIGLTDTTPYPFVMSYSTNINEEHVASITINKIKKVASTNICNKRIVLSNINANHPIFYDSLCLSEWPIFDPITSKVIGNGVHHHEDCTNPTEDLTLCPPNGSVSALADKLGELSFYGRRYKAGKWEEHGISLSLSLGRPISAIPPLGRPLPFDYAKLTFGGEDPENSFGDHLESARQLLSRAVVGPGDVLRKCLGGVRYLGPLRATPPREHEPPLSEQPGRWANGLGAWDALYRKGPDFVKAVSEWLASKDRLDTGCSLVMKEHRELELTRSLTKAMRGRDPDPEHATAILRTALADSPVKRKLTLVDQTTGIELQAHDVGVGISQLVPVVVGALDTDVGIFVVEQPELHVHPKVQVGLGDLFLTQAAKGNKMFLVETHSEHLLLRVLKRIRQTHEGTLPPWMSPITPDMVCVLYVEKTDEGTQFTELQISERGDSLGQWPEGFFEERIQELV